MMGLEVANETAVTREEQLTFIPEKEKENIFETRPHKKSLLHSILDVSKTSPLAESNLAQRMIDLILFSNFSATYDPVAASAMFTLDHFVMESVKLEVVVEPPNEGKMVVSDKSHIGPTWIGTKLDKSKYHQFLRSLIKF
jgi:hypothetical protein